MPNCETIVIDAPECVVCDAGQPFAIWQSRRTDLDTREHDQLIKYPVCSACHERMRSMEPTRGTPAYESFWLDIVSRVRLALYCMQGGAKCHLN